MAEEKEPTPRELSPAEKSRADELRMMIGLMTETDLSLLVNTTDHSLQAWRSNGIGPKYVKLGRRVMYRVCDVHEWINSSVHSGTPTAGASA